MSPTQFEAAKARIEKDVERPRKAGDIASLQVAAAEQAALFSLYYGHPSDDAFGGNHVTAPNLRCRRLYRAGSKRGENGS